jgi:hypothetical protein
MASRTSIYTNALKLPDWVMGGEFGDISTIMNNRDRQYETVAQAEQQTEKNQYDLEAKQREERMREILNDRMGNSRPATIRDAYQQMADAAYEAGDPESALEYEAKREAYDQAQLAKKRAEFSGAIGIADNAGYDRVNELYPGVLTADDYNRNQRRARASTEKTYPMYNTETKKIDPAVPYSEAMKRQESGKWIFTKDPSFNDGGLNLNMGAPEESSSGGGLFGGLFGGKPGQAPSEKQKQTVEGLAESTPGKGAEKTVGAKAPPQSSAPPRPPRPGMKWQQNKKTGEYREVPA